MKRLDIITNIGYWTEALENKEYCGINNEDFAKTIIARINEALTLTSVSQQRELLFSFANYVNNNELKEADDNVTDYSIKKFLKENNCG